MASVSAVSDVSDGPVLNLINKRIRNLRKKLNRITKLEESIAQGKTVVIHKEQQDLLNSKPSLVAVIDELEKFRQPLSVAVDEESNLAIQRKSESNQKEVNGENGKKSKRKSKNKSKTLGNVENETAPFKVDEAVEDLLSLVYFGSMFDVKSQSDFNSIMLTRSHERNCCLSYDYVTDDDAAVMLGESDLDLISSMSSLLISRPVDSSFSHQNALQSCIERAKLWIAKSEQGIASDSNVTYAALREKLAKIISSDYFKITPEMKATADVAAEAAGNCVFQVPVESAVTQQEQKQHEVEAENSMETPVQMERVETDAGGEEFKVYVPRRSYQNKRGGGHNNSGGVGRNNSGGGGHNNSGGGGHNNSGGGGGHRGFSNGRGGRSGGRGGPYQNGRNQSNEQPGNYYPRNYHGGRGRGGRGNGNGNGNGYAYNRQASGVETAES